MLGDEEEVEIKGEREGKGGEKKEKEEEVR